MNNKNTVLILILMVIIVGAIIHFNSRLNNMQLYIGQKESQNLSNFTFNQNFTSSINIEKVEGNGNSFGDNNIITNKLT